MIIINIIQFKITEKYWQNKLLLFGFNSFNNNTRDQKFVQKMYTNKPNKLYLNFELYLAK